MDVLPLCPPSMALVPLADRAVVFHYLRLSQSPMGPVLAWSGVARCGMAWCQAAHWADASVALDCLAVD